VLFYAPAADAGHVSIPIAGDDGVRLGGLQADPELGRELLRIAHSPQFLRRSLILVERTHEGVPYQIVMHTYGAFAWPEDSPGIIGYTVNLDALRAKVLGEMATSELARAAPDGREAPRLQLTVLDDNDRHVWGPQVPDATATGRVGMSLAFYPTGMPARWAGSSLPVPEWTLVVSAVPVSPSLDTQDYLFAAVLLLILIALVCAAVLHRQAVRLSQMHGDFVANVTHQLKTPLSLLAAATETMQLDRIRTPEKMREYATLVNNQTARLTALVERILRFSRIDAGAAEYEFAPVDLAHLIRSTVTRLDGTLRNGHTTLTFDAPDEAVPVVADATAIEDVMANLLENAVKYSDGAPDGRVTVQVSRAGDRALVAVRDHGIGIEPQDLPHIFDKFYRGRRTGSQTRGFGLGLSIVERVVRAHRGEIHVESVPGEGTEFRIVLPTAS
jgi:nitrogen-specific signal transduction histidine kinase